MTSYQAIQSRTRTKRLDRINKAAADVLAAMRDVGLTLHPQLGRSGANWRLSDGRAVTVEVAHIVIESPCVIGVGDSLFQNALSQTYRWLDT
jgi:hypothetical protein